MYSQITQKLFFFCTNKISTLHLLIVWNETYSFQTFSKLFQTRYQNLWNRCAHLFYWTKIDFWAYSRGYSSFCPFFDVLVVSTKTSKKAQNLIYPLEYAQKSIFQIEKVCASVAEVLIMNIFRNDFLIVRKNGLHPFSKFPYATIR